jgi:chromosome segregation ATPase
MGEFFVLLGTLGIIISGFAAIKAFIQKKPKKKYGKWALFSLVALFGGGALIPTVALEMAAESFVTNDQGIAIIEGETDPESQITIDGKIVPVKNQQFSYEITLKDSKKKKITVVATKGKANKEQEITVKPSKAFIAALNKSSDTQLDEVETALKQAEKAPTQVNYDQAATLVAALSKEYDHYTKRLTTIAENIATYEALKQAEKTTSQEDYETANTLVAKATLNKEAWTKRLATVKETITKKEQEQQLIAAANVAMEQAEKDPTNETLYNEAVSKIDNLPETDASLNQRLTTVKHKLDAYKNQQEEQAAALKEQQQAEQQAAAAQNAQAEADQAPPAAETTYLVTPNGTKYHQRKCGNGEYSPATMNVIQSRGLTPCKKCFP